MLQTLSRYLTKIKIRFNYFRLTRAIKKDSFVEIPITDFESNVYVITLPASLAKAFAWVEVNLLFDPIWTDEHLSAFYQSVIDLVSEDALTESNLYMHLHPECYEAMQDNDEDCIEFYPE